MYLHRRFIDEEMASGLMIQCDTCKCWQHGACVGLWDEKVRLFSRPRRCNVADAATITDDSIRRNARPATSASCASRSCTAPEGELSVQLRRFRSPTTL